MITSTRAISGHATFPNQFLQTDELSCEAFRLIAYLTSVPEGWEFKITDIKRRFHIGRNKIYQAVSEAMSAGYLERVQNRRAGQWDSVTYRVHFPKSPDSSSPEMPLKGGSNGTGKKDPKTRNGLSFNRNPKPESSLPHPDSREAVNGHSYKVKNNNTNTTTCTPFVPCAPDVVESSNGRKRPQTVSLRESRSPCPEGQQKESLRDTQDFLNQAGEPLLAPATETRDCTATDRSSRTETRGSADEPGGKFFESNQNQAETLGTKSHSVGINTSHARPVEHSKSEKVSAVMEAGGEAISSTCIARLEAWILDLEELGVEMTDILPFVRLRCRGRAARSINTPDYFTKGIIEQKARREARRETLQKQRAKSARSNRPARKQPAEKLDFDKLWADVDRVRAEMKRKKSYA